MASMEDAGVNVVFAVSRRELPADVSGDAGGAGLVPGPAGDHPDPQISVGHGEQQGRTLRIHTA